MLVNTLETLRFSRSTRSTGCVSTFSLATLTLRMMRENEMWEVIVIFMIATYCLLCLLSPSYPVCLSLQQSSWCNKWLSGESPERLVWGALFPNLQDSSRVRRNWHHRSSQTSWTVSWAVVFNGALPPDSTFASVKKKSRLVLLVQTVLYFFHFMRVLQHRPSCNMVGLIDRDCLLTDLLQRFADYFVSSKPNVHLIPPPQVSATSVNSLLWTVQTCSWCQSTFRNINTHFSKTSDEVT